MSEYKLKTGKAVTKGYQKIESNVVGGYQKTEDAFVESFLEKTDSSKKTTN